MSLFFLIVPFFWFESGGLDLGGDSSRLYFLDQLSYIKNISFYGIIPTFPLGENMAIHYMCPFVLLLLIIKIFLFNNAYLLNCLFYGFLLSGGFLFFYLSIKEIFIESEREISSIEKASFILTGLFFVLSPINFSTFQNAMLSNNQIMVYPLFLYIFLRFLKTEKYSYLIYLILICFIFSVNFSINVIPWFFAFFILIGVFIIFYAWIEKRMKLLLKGFVMFLSLFLLTQFFQLIPQINGMMNPLNPYSQMISGEVNKGVDYFNSIQPYVKLLYNLANQDQYGVANNYDHENRMIIYDFGVKYLFLFLIYPALIIFGFFNSNKIRNSKALKKYWVTFGIFIVILFLMTANIGLFGVDLYRKLFDLPGFSMFRSYYTKFNFVFIFFYSLLFGYSIYIIFNIVKSKVVSRIMFLGVFCLIIFNAWPFLLGKVMNTYRTGFNKIKSVSKINGDYVNFLNYIKNKKIDGKYLSFPLSGESYVVLRGENDGVYVGESMIGTIAGKNDFVGMGSFSILKKNLLDILMNNDKESFEKFNSLLNIAYITHNQDDSIYNNFMHPYNKNLKNIFSNQESISSFVYKLNLKKDLEIKNFNLYSNRDYFLPHFYTSINNVISNRTIGDLQGIISSGDWNIRSTIFFRDQNVEKEIAIEKVSELKLFEREQNSSQLILEFKKINPTKYRVRIHNAKDDFPFVFSESFNKNWKIYFSENNSKKINSSSLENYKILDGNKDDQASVEELRDFIEKGWVSDLGDGKEKEIKHKKWEDGKEKLDYVEKYKIDFISKNFQGTIQNDNLPKGNIFETWFQKPALSEENHLVANGYANSWIIDVDEICREGIGSCVKNPDGTYDLELVVEFWPQRLFYVGVAVSGTTLIGCLIFLAYSWRMRKRCGEVEKSLPADR